MSTIIAHSRSEQTLQHAVELVKRLTPGQCIRFEKQFLSEICSAELIPGYTWSPAERIMERVIGSSWSIRFREHMPTGDTIFEKLQEESDQPTYVSPDRRSAR